MNECQTPHPCRLSGVIKEQVIQSGIIQNLIKRSTGYGNDYNATLYNLNTVIQFFIVKINKTRECLLATQLQYLFVCLTLRERQDTNDKDKSVISKKEISLIVLLELYLCVSNYKPFSVPLIHVLCIQINILYMYVFLCLQIIIIILFLACIVLFTRNVYKFFSELKKNMWLRNTATYS